MRWFPANVGLGFGCSSTAVAPTFTGKCQDTVDVIADWAETLETYRQSVSYDASGVATKTWALVESFTGDWQPVSTQTIKAEAGLKVKSVAVVFGPCDLDVDENDRVQKADGTWMYVNYAQIHEEHAEIYLKRSENSE